MTIKRMTFLQELLDFIGLDGRLHLEWISSAEAQKFVQVVTDFTEKIRKLGPNPIFKQGLIMPSYTQQDKLSRQRKKSSGAYHA